MKLLKIGYWVVVTLILLVLLWVLSVIFRLGGVILALLSVPFMVLSNLLLSKTFLVLACVGIVAYVLICRRKSQRVAGRSHEHEVSLLDRRLDRLNEALRDRGY